MTLATNLFFWDDWLGVGPPPPPAPTPAPDPGAGGGGKPKGKGGKGKAKGRSDYTPADPFFWDTREAYIRGLIEESTPAAPPPPLITEEPHVAPRPRSSSETHLTQLVTSRAAVIASLRAAETISQLKERGKRLVSLNQSIRYAQQQVAAADAHATEERETAEFEERSRARQQKLSQLRGAVRVQLRKLASSRKT